MLFQLEMLVVGSNRAPRESPNAVSPDHLKAEKAPLTCGMRDHVRLLVSPKRQMYMMVRMTVYYPWPFLMITGAR